MRRDDLLHNYHVKQSTALAQPLSRGYRLAQQRLQKLKDRSLCLPDHMRRLRDLGRWRVYAGSMRYPDGG